MGYDTCLIGSFDLDKKLDDKTLQMVGKLNVDSDSFVNSNPQFEKPRVGTYGCQWIPTQDAMGIEYDGVEKFYDYIVWLEYLIQVLESRGYKLNGDVRWGGEDQFNDHGFIKVRNNSIHTDNQGVFTSADNRSGLSAFVYYEKDGDKLAEFIIKEKIRVFNSYSFINHDGVTGM
jgi:hypothetical protein